MRSAANLRFCVNTVISESINALQDMMKTNSEIGPQLASLTYEKLVEQSREAMEICANLLPDRQVVFGVSPKKDIFWKSVVKVFYRFIALKDTMTIRVLSVRQFLILFRELLRSKEQQMIQPNYNATSENDLCCICLDRVPDILLPCMHIFCQTCIYTWNGRTYKLPGQTDSSTSIDANRSQCPICRANFNELSNGWELLGPSSVEVSSYVRRLLACSGRQAVDFPTDVVMSFPPSENSSIP